MIKILLIEDELSLAEIIKDSLEYRGFTVSHASSAKASIKVFREIRPDIIVLDVMLPDGSGFDIAKHIRAVDQAVRIIFLTSKSLPNDVIKGFESGGNDYLKKPFHIEELIVRIKVLLSRNQVLLTDVAAYRKTQIGKYIFDPSHRLLVCDDTTYHLTAKESELIGLLANNKHQTINRKTLLEHIWQDDSYFAGRSMDVFISKLRKYFSKDPTIQILNIRGIGYKLIF